MKGKGWNKGLFITFFGKRRWIRQIFISIMPYDYYYDKLTCIARNDMDYWADCKQHCSDHRIEMVACLLLILCWGFHTSTKRNKKKTLHDITDITHLTENGKIKWSLTPSSFPSATSPTLKRSEKGLIIILHRRLKLLGSLHNFCLDFNPNITM